MSLKFFYNFCLKDDKTDLVVIEFVNKVLHIKDKITINSDSDYLSYEYTIEKDKPMKWVVTNASGNVLEDVTLADNEKYFIYFYKGDSLYKRILFSRLHTLLCVEYFDLPSGVRIISLEPRKAQNDLCILYDSRFTPQPVVLYPCPDFVDAAIKRRVDEDFDDYTVRASTDKGIVLFLDPDQLEKYREFIRNAEEEPESFVEESFIEGDAPLFERIKPKDFNVKRNLATGLDITAADEFSYESEEDKTVIEAADNETNVSDTDTPAESSADDNAQKPDKLIMADGAIYSYFGELDENGNRSGYGRTLTEYGRTAYEGCYENDKRSGNGSYYYKDGSLCYTGDWLENARHGVGVGVSSGDGSIHAGQWALNKPVGNGVRLTSDGDIKFVCKELSDGKTVLMNFMPDDSVIIAKYDEKGKKLGEEKLSLSEII